MRLVRIYISLSYKNNLTIPAVFWKRQGNLHLFLHRRCALQLCSLFLCCECIEISKQVRACSSCRILKLKASRTT